VVSQELADGLAAYLRRAWGDPALAIAAMEPFGDGHSGFTYAVTIASAYRTGTFVARISPPGARIAGPADVVRQGRIMSALAVAGLPTPPVLAMGGGGALGGRAFVLMERVSGVGIDDALRTQAPPDLVDAAVGVLHQLRALPLASSGIGDEPPATLQAELERWSGLMQRASDWLWPAAGRLRQMLTERVPAEEAPCLVHGDYHFGNLLFDGRRVAAVVDWEIAELGQPLLDLGLLAVTCLRRRYRPDPNPTGDLGISVGELVARYGADPEIARWYVALSCYKYAAILGYNLKLHLSGRRPDPIYEQLVHTMQGLLEDGIALLLDGFDALAGERVGRSER